MLQYSACIRQASLHVNSQPSALAAVMDKGPAENFTHRRSYLDEHATDKMVRGSAMVQSSLCPVTCETNPQLYTENDLLLSLQLWPGVDLDMTRLSGERSIRSNLWSFRETAICCRLWCKYRQCKRCSCGRAQKLSKAHEEGDFWHLLCLDLLCDCHF